MPETAAPEAAQGSSCEIRFRITGMSCAGCAAAIQRAVEAQPGVSSASVSITQGLATISSGPR